MTKYKMPSDVLVRANGNDLELQRGVLNYHDLVIDIKNSNYNLVNALFKLHNGEIYQTENKEISRDLNVLSELGYLNTVSELTDPKEVLLVTDKSEYELYKNSQLNVGKIITCDELINDDELDLITNIQNSVQKKERLKKISDKYSINKYKHIVWIDSYYDVRRIRVFNILLKFLKIDGTFAISDIDFFFLTTVRHGTTGCFECLENQIRTKIKNIELVNNPINRSNDISYSHKVLKFGYVLLILEDILNEGISNTLGNVIEFDTKTKEFFFDSNRIQTSCSVCATQNNVFHEEETIKTVNILNKLTEDNNENTK